MTNSQNNNESNPANPRTKVPFEVVDTSGQAESTAKPAKVPMEVAGLEPEPEPHEFLSAALGLKPKKKVGAKKPAVERATPVVETPVDPTPIVETPALSDPFANAPAEEPAAEADTSDDQLVSVADLGDDDEPVAEVTVEEPAATEEPPVAEKKAPAPAKIVAVKKKARAKDVAPAPAQPAVAEVSKESEAEQTDAEDETAFAEADAALENPFVAMQLAPEVLEAINKAGYETPSPIQSQTVPLLMEGRDLIGQAETGSGKTAAFAWPLLSGLDLSQKAPQVIVLAPTRELAIQVTTAFKKYASCMPGFRTTTIYGGQSYETQFRALDRGAHVVVGTPGRVMDHLKRGTLDLSQLKAFVLDEADEMLRMGFIDDIETILEATPRTQQSIFFSATMPRQIQRIASRYLTDPVQISIESKTATAESISQSCVFVSGREKQARLLRLLETEEVDGVLVFVKTRQTTLVVAEHLIQKGIIASPLNGDIAQQQRERTVGQLMSGKINVVVATDVAARGLDVKRISHVINYDFPHDTEAYVHRIGRTGRAGREGNAILFVEPKEKGKLSRLQRATNQRIDQFKERSLKEINQVRVDKFKARITEALKSDQVEFFQQMITEMQTETELPIEQLAAALGVIAQGEKPLILEAMSSRQSNWKKDSGKRGEHGQMQTYRVEVGRNDNVGPGNIVGAVTNEADQSNADIGRIKIYDRYSTIDLPANLPIDILNHLAGVFVSGRALEISKSDAPSHGGGGGGRGRDDRSSGGRGRNDRSSGSGGSGRYERGGGGDRGGRPDRGGRGREGGFSRSGGSDRSGNSDRPARKEGGFNRSEGARSRSGGGDRSASSGGGFNRSASAERSSGSDRPARREGGFKPSEGGFKPSEGVQSRSGGGDRSASRGASERPARRETSSYSDRSPKRETSPKGETNPKRETGSSSDRTDNRVYSTSKPGKTKAAQRAKAKRRPDAKASSPVKKYVKIRAKKK